MGLRTWTAEAIQNGGTVWWFVGLSIKLLFEAGVALFFGVIAAGVVVLLFPTEAISNYTEVSGFRAIWLAFSAALFWKFTLCKFTSPLLE